MAREFKPTDALETAHVEWTRHEGSDHIAIVVRLAGSSSDAEWVKRVGFEDFYPVALVMAWERIRLLPMAYAALEDGVGESACEHRCDEACKIGIIGVRPRMNWAHPPYLHMWVPTADRDEWMELIADAWTEVVRSVRDQHREAMDEQQRLIAVSTPMAKNVTPIRPKRKPAAGKAATS